MYGKMALENPEETLKPLAEVQFRGTYTYMRSIHLHTYICVYVHIYNALQSHPHVSCISIFHVSSSDT